jgi:hypothetical protein
MTTQTMLAIQQMPKEKLDGLLSKMLKYFVTREQYEKCDLIRKILEKDYLKEFNFNLLLFFQKFWQKEFELFL